MYSNQNRKGCTAERLKDSPSTQDARLILVTCGRQKSAGFQKFLKLASY